jgi:hypothetical protein
MSASFQLRPCPICSSITTLERPFWKAARHVQASTGRECYHWIGCQHAAEIIKDARKLYEDPEEIGLVEAAWDHAADALFEIRTKGWSVAAIDRFRRELSGKHHIPGTTAELPLDLTPAPPDNQTKEPSQHGKNQNE